MEKRKMKRPTKEHSKSKEIIQKRIASKHSREYKVGK